MRRNRQKGFTLIELLVVIGIMATMAAIVSSSHEMSASASEEYVNIYAAVA